jgi:dolichyl-phosphate-mannose-protein mannosyltransferase
VNRNESPELAATVEQSNFRRLILRSRRYLPWALAIAAASVFVLVASYRIHLPGLYMDEVDFVNAARGGPDNTMIYKRLGSVPLLIMPYIGALKAWIYAPVFWLFGVSALTIRLPAILLGAATLLIFFQLMQSRVGGVWAVIAIWLIAIDPTNLFTSRLDWGPTVLMHFFQAALLALWFSYRDAPKVSKLVLICICAALGFFDKFNFIWLILAFVVALALCYPDNLKDLWISSSRLARAVTGILVLIGVAAMLFVILPLLHLRGANLPPMNVEAKWAGLLSTLCGTAVAYQFFETDSWVISFVPFWLIVTDCYLALACLFFAGHDAGARENRRRGFFLLLISFFVFVQIVITPQAGGPHHYSMIFPLPVLAFVFLAQPLYSQLATKNLRRLAALFLVSAAALVFLINAQNLGAFLSRLRTDSHYSPRWSPEIYALSHYINEHRSEVKSVISVDWGLHNQLHALAPRELQQRMHDDWPTFLNLGKENQERQTAGLNRIFPEGKSFALTFAASKETFPETRKNFLAALASDSELKSRLLKQFWYAGEEIYEVYEIDRLPRQAAFSHSAPVFRSDFLWLCVVKSEVFR